jgi:hypothetical protein
MNHAVHKYARLRINGGQTMPCSVGNPLRTPALRLTFTVDKIWVPTAAADGGALVAHVSVNPSESAGRSRTSWQSLNDSGTQMRNQVFIAELKMAKVRESKAASGRRTEIQEVDDHEGSSRHIIGLGACCSVGAHLRANASEQ